MGKKLILLTIFTLIFGGCDESSNKFDCSTCQTWERCDQSSCQLEDGHCYSDQNCLGRNDGKLTCGGADGHSCIAIDPIDPCKTVTCQDHATCNDGICNCNDGFELNGDNCIATQIVTPGDLKITEIMVNPNATKDGDGEWIEFYNTTDQAISLSNLSIVKNDSTTWKLSGSIPPQTYFIIARSNNSLLPKVDLVIEDISLTNSGTHKLSIKEGATIIHEMSYEYISTMKGRSLQLDQTGRWCHGIDMISGTNNDLGTPRAKNVLCSGPECGNLYCHTFESCTLEFCFLKSDFCYTQDDCTTPLYCGGEDNHTCISDQLPLTSISDLQTDQVTPGKKVRTKGYVTAKNSALIWIQENGATNAGLMLFGVSEYTSAVIIGDQVEIEGIYTQYYTLSELDDITLFENITTTPYYPTPISLTVKEITDLTKMNLYESMIVTFDEMLTIGENSNSESIITDQSGNTMVIRNTLFNHTLPNGTKLKQISGILDRYNDQFQLIPRSISDFVEDEVTCATLSCDEYENMICDDTSGTPTCICNNDTGYFDLDGVCTNPCETAINPCSETNKTTCTPTGPTIDDVICDCDPGSIPSGDQCITDEGCFSFKAMAANISTGKDQSYTLGEGIRIFQAIKPDIVMIQEFNYKSNTTADIREFIDIAFGSDFVYSRGETGLQIPNGIISRWPILDSGYWNDPNISNRDLDWAIVDIPGERDLFVISVHLHTDPASDQIEAAGVIANEVKLIKAAQPDRYYFMVGGDFNGTSAVTDAEGYGKYGDFAINEPYPVGEDGLVTTNSTGSKHYDFVVSGTDLVAYIEPLIITNPEDNSDQKIYQDGFVFDSRDFTQGELDTYFSPVQLTDSCAEIDKTCYMQHMSVTKFYSSCK